MRSDRTAVRHAAGLSVQYPPCSAQSSTDGRSRIALRSNRASIRFCRFSGQGRDGNACEGRVSRPVVPGQAQRDPGNSAKVGPECPRLAQRLPGHAGGNTCAARHRNNQLARGEEVTVQSANGRGGLWKAGTTGINVQLISCHRNTGVPAASFPGKRSATREPHRAKRLNVPGLRSACPDMQEGKPALQSSEHIQPCARRRGYGAKRHRRGQALESRHDRDKCAIDIMSP